MTWWMNLNTTLKILVCAALIGLVVWLVSVFKADPKPPEQPIAVHQAEKAPSIPHGSDKLPQPDEHIAGVTTITLRDTVKPGDTVGTVHEHTVTLYSQDDPKDPPFVHSEHPVDVTYSQVRDPYFNFHLEFLAGAGVTETGQPTPAGMLSGLTLFSRVRLGAGVDRFGFGPAAAVEVWREWNVVGSYHVLPFQAGGPRAALAIAYRF